MSERTAIIIDFDRTLFDADAFGSGLHDSVKTFGVTKKMWDRCYEEAGQDGIFRLGPFVEALAAKTGRAPADIRAAVDAETAEAIWYLHADSRAFLETFSTTARLFLVTLGCPELQRQKVAAVGLSQYFEEIIVVEQPKAESGKLPVSAVEQAVFINDDLDELLELAQVYRWAHHVHVNRARTELPPRFPFRSFPDLRSATPYVASIVGPVAEPAESVDTQPRREAADPVADQGSRPAE